MFNKIRSLPENERKIIAIVITTILCGIIFGFYISRSIPKVDDNSSEIAVSENVGRDGSIFSSFGRLIENASDSFSKIEENFSNFFSGVGNEATSSVE